MVIVTVAAAATLARHSTFDTTQRQLRLQALLAALLGAAALLFALMQLALISRAPPTATLVQAHADQVVLGVNLLRAGGWRRVEAWRSGRGAAIRFSSERAATRAVAQCAAVGGGRKRLGARLDAMVRGAASPGEWELRVDVHFVNGSVVYGLRAPLGQSSEWHKLRARWALGEARTLSHLCVFVVWAEVSVFDFVLFCLVFFF